MYMVGMITDMIVELMDDVDPYRGMSYEEEFMEIAKMIFNEEDVIEQTREYIKSLERDEDEEAEYLARLGGISIIMESYLK